jgi:hypothetical protein
LIVISIKRLTTVNMAVETDSSMSVKPPCPSLEFSLVIGSFSYSSVRADETLNVIERPRRSFQATVTVGTKGFVFAFSYVTVTVELRNRVGPAVGVLAGNFANRPFTRSAVLD